MKNSLPEIHSCSNKEDLLKQIIDSHQALVNFYKEIPSTIFQDGAIPDGWSVKKNMKHVISSTNLFTLYLKLPKFFMKIFGKPKKNQKPIEEVVPTNRPNIKDFGKYTTAEIYKPREKEKIIQGILDSAEKLKKSVEKFSENELNNLSVFLGISLRNFILIVLKHNIYHVNVARTRLINTSESFQK
ncbi:MAG: hypothetical protein L6Q54_07970 [Leptospiraceae bacterium]|nr:hypothetical protein [Leptospiraceae bacterium]MCK6381171.1 hypothetical protein [Leptospiraceae bacterium]NUM40859.1 hypothetical protein [Leptospiraceae bacterium]